MNLLSIELSKSNRAICKKCNTPILDKHRIASLSGYYCLSCGRTIIKDMIKYLYKMSEYIEEVMK